MVFFVFLLPLPLSPQIRAAQGAHSILWHCSKCQVDRCIFLEGTIIAEGWHLGLWLVPSLWQWAKVILLSDWLLFL